MKVGVELETWREQIDAQLDALVPCGAPLFAAARYSLLSPGKRLRPLLVLATAEAYGVDVERALVPACALEMIHTYSLIHDDLPCMDNDDLRRGVPTLHKVYPEWHALLAGDYLLTYAFEVLAKAPGLSVEQRLELVQQYATYAGGGGMIGGQMIDLLSQHLRIEYTTLVEMHRGKTAALITAALIGGAIIAGVEEGERALLRQVGEEIGLGFQIVDDLLDYEGSVEELGKPIGSDLGNEKATAVSVLGVEGAREMATKLWGQVQGRLAQLAGRTEMLEMLFRKMIDRRR